MNRSSAQVTLIQPSKGWSPLNLSELWQYRELLWMFTLRDIKVRYKQTALGPLWVIIPPLLSTGIFSLILGGLADLPSGDLPYPLFVFTAMMGFNLFSVSMNKTSNSLAANEGIFTKVYFPRLIAPLAGAVSGLVDFIIGFAVLLIAFLAFGQPISINILLLPLFILLAILSGLGIGIWLSAISVKYRDFRMASPLLTQIFTWTAPVMYSSELIWNSSRVPEPVQTLYRLNPLYWVADGFRWCLFSFAPGAPKPIMIVSVLAVLTVLVTGLYYFKRVEAVFADVI